MVGKTLSAVHYSDVHAYGPEPREWDYGDWHHSVMGLELSLSDGPASVLWTNTFHPYGIDVMRQPLSDYLLQDEYGPEVWDASDHPFWSARIGQLIQSAELKWDRLELGASYRNSDGAKMSDPHSIDVPIILRLNFETGPVWFIVAIPQLPAADEVFGFGDEIMVILTREKMLRIGLPPGR